MNENYLTSSSLDEVIVELFLSMYNQIKAENLNIEKLKKTDNGKFVEMLRSSINASVNKGTKMAISKIKEEYEKREVDERNQYEELIRKLENDIRGHFKVKIIIFKKIIYLICFISVTPLKDSK